MSSEWTEVRLKDVLAEPVRNGLYKPKQFHGDGAKIINMGELFAHPRLGAVEMRRLRVTDDELERFRVAPGDLLFARRSLVAEGAGKCALVTDAREPTVFESSLIRARPDPSVAVSEYLYYFFSSRTGQQRLQSILRQVAVSGITGSDLVQLRVPLPTFDEQRRIAGVLSALDDKIEQNRRLADTASQLLALIFFQKCAGLPEDHREVLTGLADFVNGGAFTKHANGTGRPIIRIKELNDGVGESTPRTDFEVRDENIARHHDLLFSWSGSLDVYRWAGPEAVINQHIFKVIPRDGYPHWFVEGWLRHHLPEFQAIAREKATTMGHIKRHHLDDAIVAVPDTELLVELDTTLGPLDELRGNLSQESRRLSAIRYALLPKLVSGQIRMPESYDPDKVLGTVVEQATAG